MVNANTVVVKKRPNTAVMVNDNKLIFDFIKPSQILRVNRCIKEYFLLKPQKKRPHKCKAG